MPFVAGVDGAKANWFMVWRDAGGKVSSACARTPEDLCEVFALADVIAVDVPIGLTESGPRYCDREARKALGALRASSVFPAPIRPVLSANTREGASLVQKRIDGRGISAQGWGIVPKICQWDSYLRANLEIARRIYEVHPEVCFWALNASRPMQYRKKCEEGRRERRELLERVLGRAHSTRRAYAMHVEKWRMTICTMRLLLFGRPNAYMRAVRSVYRNFHRSIPSG
jgi:predicted RNase H-like nuclease